MIKREQRESEKEEDRVMGRKAEGGGEEEDRPKRGREGGGEQRKEGKQREEGDRGRRRGKDNEQRRKDIALASYNRGSLHSLVQALNTTTFT